MPAITANRTGDGLKTPLRISVFLHAAIGGALILSAIYSHRGQSWGGPGGAISVGIAGSVPAIPLPHPDVMSPSRVVDNSKGLYKAEPAPKIAEPPPPDAIPIPRFEKLKPPPPPKKQARQPVEDRMAPVPPKTHPSKILENKIPPPENAVPYGQGGAPTVPVTSFAMGAGNTQGGLTFHGVAGGNFGSQYADWVSALQRKVSGNWQEYTVDPNVQSAPTVVVTFTVLSNGTFTNIQVTRSSNNSSVDNSAIRAIRDSAQDPLPEGYSGSYVNVEFSFDFHR